MEKTIIKRFLEARFEEFQWFIESDFELEPTEAERIIDTLEVEEE